MSHGNQTGAVSPLPQFLPPPTVFSPAVLPSPPAPVRRAQPGGPGGEGDEDEDQLPKEDPDRINRPPTDFVSYARLWLAYIAALDILLCIFTLLQHFRDGDSIPRERWPVMKVPGGWPDTNYSLRIWTAGIGIPVCLAVMTPLILAPIFRLALPFLLFATTVLSMAAFSTDIDVYRKRARVYCNEGVALCDNAPFIATIVFDAASFGLLVLLGAMSIFLACSKIKKKDQLKKGGAPIDTSMGHGNHFRHDDPQTAIVEFLRTTDPTTEVVLTRFTKVQYAQRGTSLLALVDLFILLLLTISQHHTNSYDLARMPRILGIPELTPDEWDQEPWKSPRDHYLDNAHLNGRKGKAEAVLHGGWPPHNNMVRIAGIAMAFGFLLTNTGRRMLLYYSPSMIGMLACFGLVTAGVLLWAFALDWDAYRGAAQAPFCTPGFECSYGEYFVVLVLEFLVAVSLVGFCLMGVLLPMFWASRTAATPLALKKMLQELSMQNVLPDSDALPLDRHIDELSRNNPEEGSEDDFCDFDDPLYPRGESQAEAQGTSPLLEPPHDGMTAHSRCTPPIEDLQSGGASGEQAPIPAPPAPAPSGRERGAPHSPAAASPSAPSPASSVHPILAALEVEPPRMVAVPPSPHAFPRVVPPPMASPLVELGGGAEPGADGPSQTEANIGEPSPLAPMPLRFDPVEERLPMQAPGGSNALFDYHNPFSCNKCGREFSAAEIGSHELECEDYLWPHVGVLLGDRHVDPDPEGYASDGSPLDELPPGTLGGIHAVVTGYPTEGEEGGGLTWDMSPPSSAFKKPSSTEDLIAGDVVLEFGGCTVDCKARFGELLSQMVVDSTVGVKVYRPGLGRIVNCNVRVHGKRGGRAGFLNRDGATPTPRRRSHSGRSNRTPLPPDPPQSGASEFI